MDIKTRNIWVLGGTGFVGSALVKHLFINKNNRLNLLIHKKADYGSLENINAITGSINDFDSRWLERYPPDILFHLARPSGSNYITRKIRSSAGERANRRLVNILCGIPEPPMVVYVSGSLMYGERSADEPAYEDSPLDPASYARFYYRNELPWIEAQQDGLLDVRFARPGWIAGPSSWFMKFFWKHFTLSGKVPVYGDGQNPMSVIHIDDCAAMIDGLSLYGAKGSNLNIYAADTILQSNFSKLLAKILNAETENISYNYVRRKYGEVTAKALVSSSPMKTLYPALHRKTRIQFPETSALLADVVRLLKNI